MGSVSYKKFLVWVVLLSSLLSAENISVNSANFTVGLNSSNIGDTIVLDDKYHLNVNIKNIRDVFIYGNGSVLYGDYAGTILQTADEGDFTGVGNIALQNGNGSAGGAIHVGKDLKSGVYNSNLSNNYASNGGGAIYVYNDFKGDISNSIFLNNRAYDYGGAISAAHHMSGTISNSTFSGNSVLGNSFGGGAMLAATFTGTITNSIFSFNNAYNGGAVYFENANGIISNTNFINNTARENGGAIYIYGTSNLTLHSSSDMLFYGNRDKNSSNAIYYYGYGGYSNGNLKIYIDDNATMEFRDTIADYGSGEEGKLYVDKNGEGTLIYNAAMTYRGDTNIYSGTLFLGIYGSVAGNLNIGDNATLSINKDRSYALGANVNISSGNLNIDLNDISRRFYFASDDTWQNFNGTLALTNAYYNSLKDGYYSIILNNNSRANINYDNSSLKDIIFNGGILNLNVMHQSSEPALSVAQFNIGSGGTVVFNTDITNNPVSIPNDINLYDALHTVYGPSYQIISASNGVHGDYGLLNIVDSSSHSNQAKSNIIQNSELVGEIYFGAVGEVKNDGIYLGYGLQGVKSLTNVIFDGVVNGTFNAMLMGNGNFTFANHTAYIGNPSNNYTGSTFLQDSASVIAISNNSLGKTNGLNIGVDAIFDLNAFSQIIYGNVNNSGSIQINNGTLTIQGLSLNNNIIDLGSNGSLTFSGAGASLGNNSLTGDGTVVFGDNFEINGTNDNLYADIIVSDGTISLNHVNSLGLYGNINMSSYSSNIAFNIIDNSEILNKNITGGGSFSKMGNGTLTLGGNYSYTGVTEIIEGLLVSKADNFHGNINIFSNASMIFDQQNDYSFSHQLSGGGNISQIGGFTLHLKNNHPNFTGTYNILDGALRLDPNNFGGDIDISQVSNLIFEQNHNSYFTNHILGYGNITQLGYYTLYLSSNNADFKGYYNIAEGTLIVNSLENLANSAGITIENGAVYFVNSTSNETLNNNLYGSGNFHIDLNSNDNFILLNNIDSFLGSVVLQDTSFLFDKNLSNLSLVLNENAITYLNDMDLTLKNLTFDGGALSFNTTNATLPSEVMLTVDELEVRGRGGSIFVDANVSSLVSSVTDGLNLYDYNTDLVDSYQVISVANVVGGAGTQLNVINSFSNKTSIDIVQNGDIAGEAIFGIIAQMQSDGLYLGFGLQSINSLTNIVLDSQNSTNGTLNAVLTGTGNFTFTGNNSAYVGNADSNYTGSTLLKSGAYITSISDKTFGDTNRLTIERNALFDLNSHYQIVEDLNNSGTIFLDGGWFEVNDYTFNDGVIDLGSYAVLFLNNQGVSIGNNSLSGYGNIYLNGDFNISGANTNLYADILVYDGNISVDDAKALGSNGYIYAGYDTALIFDLSDNGTFDKDINSYGLVVKQGNATLALNRYAQADIFHVLDGALALDASKIYGNINVSSVANLIFDNSDDAVFYNQLLGEGNITQTGNYTLMIDSDNSNFTGQYSVNEGMLVLGQDAIIGADISVNSASLATYGKILGSLSLNNSQWQLGSSYNITNLFLSNSDVYLGEQIQNFDTHQAVALNINNLSGNGSFYQRLNIEKYGGTAINSGDIIVINNSSSGSYTLHFNDKSTGNISLRGDEELLVVRQENQAGSYNADFTGQIDLGGFTYTLEQSNLSTSKNVYLKSDVCSNAACASLSFPNINYFTNYASTNILLQRMGEINIDKAVQDDIWIKTFFGKINSFDERFKIDGVNYYGFNAGVDRTYSNTLFGFMVGYSNSDIDYKIGSADSQSYEAGIYASFKNEDGFYMDYILKYQMSKNSFNTQTSNGFDVDGEGDADTVMFAVQNGKKYDILNGLFYIEPQIQFTFSHQNSLTMHSSNNLHTKIDSSESLQARLSAIFGYRLKNIANAYLKAGYIKGFGNEVSYSFNDKEKGLYKIEGDFFDGAVGVNYRSKNHNLYFEGGYQTGKMFDNMKVNLGYIYNF